MGLYCFRYLRKKIVSSESLQPSGAAIDRGTSSSQNVFVLCFINLLTNSFLVHQAPQAETAAEAAPVNQAPNNGDGTLSPSTSVPDSRGKGASMRNSVRKALEAFRSKNQANGSKAPQRPVRSPHFRPVTEPCKVGCCSLGLAWAK